MSKTFLCLCVPLLAFSAPTKTDVELLYARERAARKKVIAVRGTDFNSAVDMKTDVVAVKAVKKLQDVTKKLLQTKWNKYTRPGGKDDHKGTVFHIKAVVTFPDRMPDVEKGNTGSFVIETAPIDLMPHTVFNFVDMVTAEAKIPPYFYLNAPHILMMSFDDEVHHKNDFIQAFQEYSDKYPHEPFTVGFGGRPGGPSTYISKIDNQGVHGPGSQGSTMNEADSCFGRIVEGQDVIERLMHVWGKAEHGFNVNEVGEIMPRQEVAQVAFSLCKKSEC